MDLGCRLSLWLPAALAIACFEATAAPVYETEFEEFPVGANEWSGNGGWSTFPAAGVGTGVEGIDQDIIPGGGLGRTAYLGLKQPVQTVSVLYRPIAYDPAATGVPTVRFHVLFGIADSTNGHRDSFYFYFYNAAGTPMAGIGFLNNNFQAVSRYDGVSQALVTPYVYFTPGQLMVLRGQINLATNRWSAELDDVPLFEDAGFHAGANPVGLGLVGFLWQLGAGGVSNYGDNWMLVADLGLYPDPVGQNPFRPDWFARGAPGTASLGWTGQPGFDYRVHWSDDLIHWWGDLPASSFPGITVTQPLTFTDSQATGARRFYRIERTETP